MSLQTRLKLCLFLIHLAQLICSITTAATLAWLFDLISSRSLGLSGRHFALLIMSSVTAVYLFIMILLTHRPKHPTHRSTHAITLCLDVVLFALVLAFLIIASAAGVPANCAGMTRLNYNVNDAPNDPAPGYTTVRFGPSIAGQKGMLDRYCPDVERTFYLELIVLGLIVANAAIKAILLLMGKYRLVRRDLEDARPKEGSESVSMEDLSARTAVSVAPSVQTSETITVTPPEPVALEPIKQINVTEESTGGRVCNGFRPSQAELATEDRKEPPPYLR